MTPETFLPEIEAEFDEMETDEVSE